MPVKVGCFYMFDAAKVALPTGLPASSPAACLSACLGANAGHRYGALQGGDSCYCYSELPLDGLEPVQNDFCRKPCSDPLHFCGGDSVEYLLFYVAKCETARRFGDSCLLPVEVSQGIARNADYCYALGLELFWPDSKEVRTFFWLHWKLFNQSINRN